MPLVNLLLSLVIFGLPLTVIHELGHLLAAKIMQFKIYRIELGRGPKLLQWKVKDISIIIRTGWGGGVGRSAVAPPPGLPGILLRFLCIVAAGPAVHLILLLLECIVYPQILPLAVELLVTNKLAPPLVLFVYANIMFMLLSSIPLKLVSGYSDGYAIVHLLLHPKEGVLDIIDSYYMNESHKMISQRDYDLAAAVISRGLKQNPQSATLRIKLSDVKIRQGQYSSARAILLDIIKSKSVTKLPMAQTSELWSLIAYCNILLGDCRLIDEAKNFSARAFKAAPNSAIVLGRRGVVLIATGRFLEGIALLERGFKEAEDDWERAEYAAWISLAFFELHEPTEAIKWLKFSTKLCPDTPTARRLKAFVTRMQFD